MDTTAPRVDPIDRIEPLDLNRSAHDSIDSRRSKCNCRIVKIAPVIFTNNFGQGPGEYHASPNPNNPDHHIIPISTPDGTEIIEAWYSPFHNIGQLTDFAWIDVNRASPTAIELTAAGYGNGVDARLRIKICVLCG